MAGRLDTRWVSEERRRPCSILWPDRTEQGRAGGQPARKPGQEAWTGGRRCLAASAGGASSGHALDPGETDLQQTPRGHCYLSLPGSTPAQAILSGNSVWPICPANQEATAVLWAAQSTSVASWGTPMCVISGHPLHQQGTGVRSKQQPPLVGSERWEGVTPCSHHCKCASGAPSPSAYLRALTQENKPIG